jgi:hypothetical protein
MLVARCMHLLGKSVGARFEKNIGLELSALSIWRSRALVDSKVESPSRFDDESSRTSSALVKSPARNE